MITHGIINLLKPAGMTSHDCVYQLRKITGIKRIGHTGTLDPMAAGVLPLCIGCATRIIDYLDMDKKVYRCEMILGVTTDTWDIWGSIIDDKRKVMVIPGTEELTDQFKKILGRIYQTPPSYSSVRVGGKRLYEYAREGIEIEAKKRPVVVYDISVIDYDKITGRIVYDLTCSKGTYVRSICHDIGKTFGCGGSMSFLLRMASGDFTLKNSVPLEHLQDKWRNYLLPVDYPLTKLGKLKINIDRMKWFCDGGYLRDTEAEIVQMPSVGKDIEHIRCREGLRDSYRVYSEEKFLGVAIFDKEKNIFKADKVLCR